MTKDRTNAKVAKILDVYRLAINRGAIHGIAKGQRFTIGGTPEDVYDPEDGSYLGQYSPCGLSLVVTEVYERCAVAETYLASSKQMGSVVTVNIGDDVAAQF